MEMGATGTRMTFPGAVDFTIPLPSKTKTVARAKTFTVITRGKSLSNKTTSLNTSTFKMRK